MPSHYRSRQPDRGPRLPILRRMAILVVVVLLITGLGPTVNPATPPPTLVVDGVVLGGQSPLLEGDRVLLPFRAIMEALGAVVTWDDVAREASALLGERRLVLAPERATALVDGAPVPLAAPTRLQQGRLFAPMGFAEGLGVRSFWDDLTRTAVVAGPAFPGVRQVRGPSSSLITLHPDGRTAWVANPVAGSISAITLSAFGPWLKVAEIPVGDDPVAIAIAPDGRRAYVTLQGEDRLAVVDLRAQRVTAKLPVGNRPYGVVADPRGHRVYVAIGGSDRIAVVSPARLQVVATARVEEHPMGLALAANGQTLYATHFWDGRLSVMDTRDLAVRQVVTADPRANFSQFVLLNRKGDRAYLPYQLQNHTEPAPVFDSFVFPVVAAVDLEQGVQIRKQQLSLDTVDQPVSQPIAAALTDDDRFLYVVNANSDDVSVVDLTTGEAVAHLSVGVHPRGIVKLPGRNRALVANVLSTDVTVIDTANHSVLGRVAVSADPRPELIRKGHRIFVDASLSKDSWMSCATCHFDGLSDRRVWNLGLGPRATKMLRGIAGTEPFHWSGELDDLPAVVHAQLKSQSGPDISAADVQALQAYVFSREFPRSPYLQADGSLTPTAVRGRRVFKDAGCLLCHGPPRGTDNLAHDVGTGDGPAERYGPEFFTPPLGGLWLKGPYLHDGSAADLYEMLELHDPFDFTGGLSQADLDALVLYMKSLPDPEWAGTGAEAVPAGDDPADGQG